MQKLNIYYENLFDLVKNLGKSMNCIKQELSYLRNALSNYKYTSNLSAIILLDISHYFGVFPGDMMELETKG